MCDSALTSAILGDSMTKKKLNFFYSESFQHLLPKVVLKAGNLCKKTTKPKINLIF